MEVKLPNKRSESSLEKPVILINRFTTKPGMQDKFAEAQIAEYRRLRGKVKGSISIRLHKATDGKTVVNYARFASERDYHVWVESQLFAEHKKIIEPFVEKAEPVLVEVIYDLDENGENIAPPQKK